MVLDYAEGGNLHNWLNKNYHDINWSHIIEVLLTIIRGLKEIHQKNLVHHDFHAGNILSNFTSLYYGDLFRISDMGLCRDVNNTDETKIFGVTPYVAPEVLGEGKPYTQAADIYSFGMIMYLMATGRQPFNNRAHDEILILDICDGIRPEINELDAPKCYIDLMKRCWDSNPDNRPNAIEICKTLRLFWNSYNVEKRTRFYYDEEEEQDSDDEEEEQICVNENELNELIQKELKSLQYSYYNDRSKWKEKYSDDENIEEYVDDEMEEQYIIGEWIVFIIGEECNFLIVDSMRYQRGECDFFVGIDSIVHLHLQTLAAIKLLQKKIFFIVYIFNSNKEIEKYVSFMLFIFHIKVTLANKDLKNPVIPQRMAGDPYSQERVSDS
ncbi:kinase-like domain-containing protein [Rhizophagus diaphanus]|nr:kinase-like domain-containing protein [Rhizophagus diaphanus] [Rhizophagus sp. MUCL 43196]